MERIGEWAAGKGMVAEKIKESTAEKVTTA
jgi:hypothetical protein